MSTHRSINLTNESTYSIKDAATTCGVSEITIRRRLTDQRFPSATKENGEWRIPGADLGAVAAEEGWVISPDQSADQSADYAPAYSPDQVTEAIEGRLLDQFEIDQLRNQLEQAERERDRARSDQEHWRTEHEKRVTEVAELDKAKAVAEARTEELRTQLEVAQKNVTEHQGQIDQQAKTLAERDVELVSMGDRSTELEKERSEALSEAAKLKDSMGWWSRRRYEKRDR